ncbi:hypothetical protein [Mycoplasma phocimorsus]|uniref:hypothetical protein n=1 Tax=Mycoplasma phocimorsus TaxID=3045839 RepID=UPI0024C06333|nr:hypothetical protein [Mycoplasma phocimorsus]MDJ1647927.1 hypothetical protein [Mycoplasma phocimorsus]
MYLEVDDKQAHINLLQFLIDNEILNKPKNGLYVNISFEREVDKDENNLSGKYKYYYKLLDFFNENAILK